MSRVIYWVFKVNIRMGVRMAIRIAFEWEDVCEMAGIREESQAPAFGSERGHADGEAGGTRFLLTEWVLNWWSFLGQLFSCAIALEAILFAMTLTGILTGLSAPAAFRTA
jgi:hypothetical protein